MVNEHRSAQLLIQTPEIQVLVAAVEMLEVGGDPNSFPPCCQCYPSSFSSVSLLSLFPHWVGQSTKEKGGPRRKPSLSSGVKELDLVQMERPKASDF